MEVKSIMIKVTRHTDPFIIKGSSFKVNHNSKILTVYRGSEVVVALTEWHSCSYARDYSLAQHDWMMKG